MGDIVRATSRCLIMYISHEDEASDDCLTFLQCQILAYVIMAVPVLLSNLGICDDGGDGDHHDTFLGRSPMSCLHLSNYAYLGIYLRLAMAEGLTQCEYRSMCRLDGAEKAGDR